MNSKKCLYCYGNLENNVDDFHPACSKKIFGKPIPPELPYNDKDLMELGLKVIRSHSAITGAQTKLSLGLEKTGEKGTPMRLTIVGLLGQYILKPQTELYNHLPEVEDLTMHLAEQAGIATVPHSLIRMNSGSLAYITKRIDRLDENKIHMEDMCQLTERMTEHKYHGSYEQIGKIISLYSANPGLDLVNFYEQVLFSFITGNADMHLKNFSLISNFDLGYSLTPAYDMVSTALVMPSDTEELALNLNGKKKKLRLSDFMKAMTVNGIADKPQQNILKKFKTTIPTMIEFVDQSFLPDAMQKKYKEIIYTRSKQFYLI
ncbi:MAG: toxin HipA [Bacteroidetes bacterium GWF2_38_335]|nr:MAG: toxin HipA [Bacteroidetes bacterium GWF2_38_335]OFY81435.1 MAG: toxin HipA [Bacteroidetes bacterium RIFOXYA12_FULL_38_20]HBS85310.1 toxin HipA [Bacteroidales bacterium]